jgi:hypothetical protein
LIDNDENCIHGHFYDVTVSKMAAKKSSKCQWSPISMKIDKNNPRYQFSLQSENIEILPILSAAILKIKMTLNAIFDDFVGGHFENGGHSLAISLGQNILPNLLNIYAIQGHFYFQDGRRQYRQNFNVL